jgi:hypothetical protein
MPLFGAKEIGPKDPMASMASLSTENWDLERVTVAHLYFETTTEAALRHLPRALSPTRPASVIFTVWDVPESPAGPFRLAQVRIGCRAGARGRALLTRAVVDSERAAGELEGRWGFACLVGAVQLARYHDVCSAQVSVDGAGPVLELSVDDPEPISGGDIQWPASLHLARVRSEDDEVLLLQVDPEFEFHRADRGVPRIASFDPDFWLVPGLTPARSISGVTAEVRVLMPRLRFVLAPDRDVFEGTRRIGAAAR